MSAYCFIAGFATATIVLIIAIAAIYLGLAKKRAASDRVQGYLDLMPDLSETQRRQVQEIREVFLPRMAEIRKSLYLKRSELAHLLFEAPIERERIDETARSILDAQATLEAEVIDHILEEKELLSPLQKRKFYEIIVQQFSSGGLGVHDVKGRKTRHC